MADVNDVPCALGMFAAAKHRISAVNRITDETGEEHMNKDWADKNKRMQSLIGKETSFREGLVRRMQDGI